MRGTVLRAVTVSASVALVTGCTGDTGIRLTVETPEGPIPDLDPQFCAGADKALEEPINGWIAPARDLFPATDVLAPEGE
jgi:hypothetical protein